jgi:GTPase Era involved in 16S rRNA processing
MRPDTSLVIVDVPGLNEAGSCDMYKGYVDQQWDTYDCAVVIMDAEKGVNTDEQVWLLEFVKMKQQTSKDIPVIVLCNKVDDPSNEEIAIMVNEVREKVKEVFNVDSSSATLEKDTESIVNAG